MINNYHYTKTSMRKATTVILAIFACLAARADLAVTDFTLSKNKISSGEHFDVHAVVTNTGSTAEKGKIALKLRSAPDGFYGYDDCLIEVFAVDLAAGSSMTINYDTSMRGEDERLEYYFTDKSNKVISDYVRLQLGECGDEVLKVELSLDFADYIVGHTFWIIASVYPGSAPQKVVYSVDDPSIAEITEVDEDYNCHIKCLKPGKTEIRATAVNGIFDTMALEVSEERVKAESVTLNVHEITGKPGDTYQLEATVMPAEADQTVVVYFSMDEKVADVDRFTGLVTIKTEGSTEIVAIADGAKDICNLNATAGLSTLTSDSENRFDIYTADGRFIKRVDSPDAIDSLEKGIYILKGNGVTKKILR